MRRLLAGIERHLGELREAGLLRRLEEPRGVDFSSNDYLGISRHPALKARVREALEEDPVTAPASRLLRGNTRRHLDLEERLARWKGTEAALFFASGYQANLAVLSALIRPGDLAISDELNHASIIDGLRLARPEKEVVPHLDAGAVERALARRQPGQMAFIVTESLFSMEADRAPLAAYAVLAARHDAALIVDDAHATGLFGSRGSGLCEDIAAGDPGAVIMSTCGKALGVSGAFVAGPRPVIDSLINTARPFIFSTAPPPLLLAAVQAALDIVELEPWRRSRCMELARRLRAALRAAGLDCLRSEGPIVPVLLGETLRAVTVAEEVRKRGHDVRPIRPPSVPPGTARLRISIHADHEEGEVDALAAAVIDAAARHGAAPVPP